ncbi:PRC and DUF2382 domain-containing protein [Streptomyces sp. CRN 30]|uniref:PRC and DUF2382 domain-containing protein n=1 Tax=Streptomyces sp. CRN 30 TaxID=3075613 RepID=UPI002A827C9E|nr:PRC and DUF2382 domain-containing protein [Streptomyces sp. CRN 30]
MITREEITMLLDHPVYDGEGHKIGDAKHVFFDDMTGRPEWVSVKTGMFGSNESFIPIHDATLVEDHLEVPYRKDQVKGAPNVDIDAGGHLSASEEHRLYEYYGVNWDNVLSDDGMSGDGGMGTDTTTTDTTAAAGTAGVAGTASVAGTAGYEGTGRRSLRDDDDAMTLSEERMHVGVERRETGRARLRKYVVTEEVQQIVPVRHEEVRVEREPITDANRDAAYAGPEFTEAEHEVTLHEETPVVETEAVAVERVRLTTEEHVDDRTVRGQVRKERIETEGIDLDEDVRRRPGRE